jgi:hypothetical protein
LRAFGQGIRAFLNWLPSAFTNSNPTVQGQLLLAYWSRLAGQTAHEVGHAPGRQDEMSDHAEEGLMKTGGDFFPGPPTFKASQKLKASTINRFRTALQWNN